MKHGLVAAHEHCEGGEAYCRGEPFNERASRDWQRGWIDSAHVLAQQINAQDELPVIHPDKRGRHHDIDGRFIEDPNRIRCSAITHMGAIERQCLRGALYDGLCYQHSKMKNSIS